MSLLAISENVRLFANTLTADDQYSLCNMKTLLQQIQKQLSKKQQTFVLPSFDLYFQNYGLQKTWLDKCLNNPDSEHLSTVNMLKVHKHCGNMWRSTFIIFSISISEICIQFWPFLNKRWPSLLMYLWNYKLPKTWLDKCLKSSSFRTPFDIQHAKVSQRLPKSVRKHLYHISLSLWGK